MPSDASSAGSPAGPRPARNVPRSLTDLVERLPGAVLRPPAGPDVDGVVLRGATLDSRAVTTGDLYCALPGSTAHGAVFGAQAVAAGAVALLTDDAGSVIAAEAGLTVPVVVVAEPRSVVGEVSAWIYGEPATRLTTFGVTGTNGKTTTTFLLASALDRSGHRCGLIGTVENRVGALRLPSVRTTPEAPALQAMLAVMCEEGADSCALEISSHALRLHRVDGLTVDVAGFTNLSRDHLDFHPDMEDYFAAKADLFTPRRARRAVVCIDDPWGVRMAAHARAQGLPTVTFATGGAAGPGVAPDVRVEADPEGAITLRRSGQAAPLCRLLPPLPGSFNQANAALATLMLVQTGMPADEAAAAVAAAGSVPGRMERVLPADSSGAVRDLPLAVVDYAHTPSAVGAALRALAGRRPLVVVLGAGGDRDRDKRPLMGAEASAAADVVVVTDDNPRTEDPADIRAAVLAGTAQGSARVLEVADRRDAIAIGVELAMPIDAPPGTVLVAGKGHERGQDYGDGVPHPFDDRLVLVEALRRAAGGEFPRPETKEN